MNKFTGKYEKLHEETLFRYQQGGFLAGDYARIRKDALKRESVGNFSDQMKSILHDAIKNETVLRVSYIKSGKSEAFKGIVDASNIPSCELWADCYVEHAPGMWHNVMTIPLSILEKIEVEGAEGYAPYNKNLIRPNTEEPGAKAKELKNQTMGDDESRQLATKNAKLANTKDPKDGRKQAPFKEGVEYGKENDFIFEQYRNTLVTEIQVIDGPGDGTLDPSQPSMPNRARFNRKPSPSPRFANSRTQSTVNNIDKLRAMLDNAGISPEQYAQNPAAPTEQEIRDAIITFTKSGDLFKGQ